MAVFSPNSEAAATSRRSQDGDLSGFQHLQQAELGGCGEYACRWRTERGSKARLPAGGQGHGCGAAEGIPGRSQHRGLTLPRLKAEGRPSCGLGGRGLSQGPAAAPFPSLLRPLFSSGSFLPPSAGSADSTPSATRPVLDLGFLPCSPTSLLVPSPRPITVAEMAGSSEPGVRPDFPFSPGLPYSVPDVSWRKPIYPNGE